MFDRDLYPSVDRLLADLEAQSGYRVQVLLDACQGWGTARPAEPPAAPISIITVNSQAHDIRHTVASFFARTLLRRFQQKPLLLAAANDERRSALAKELASSFTDIPAAKLPGLTAILYDGLSQQFVSVLRGVIVHRAIASEQADLRLQHRQFLTALLNANAKFLDSGGDPRYPAWFARANRRLLAVEAIALIQIMGEPHPLRDRLASAGLTTDAEPLVAAIAAGDLDGLSDRHLTDLAISHSGAPGDWLRWITPDGEPHGIAPQVIPKDVVRPQPGPASMPAEPGSYQARRDQADRMRRDGDYQAAVAIYDVLLADGGNADQGVLVGKAACLAAMGRDLDEVRGIAKAAIAMDPTTDAAEEARHVITKLSIGKLHNDFPVRPDVVAYMREAIATYRRIKQAQGQALWAELGMLGASGLRDDGQARYKTKTLPSKTFTGLAAIVYIHVGTRLYAPQVVDQLGHDFDREWAAATNPS